MGKFPITMKSAYVQRDPEAATSRRDPNEIDPGSLGLGSFDCCIAAMAMGSQAIS